MALYRNWPEIARVTRENWPLWMLLCFTPIKEDDEAFIWLYMTFETCFTSTEPGEPITLSRILSETATKKTGTFVGDPTSILDKHGIPWIDFSFKEISRMKLAYPECPLTLSEAQQLKVGSILRWQWHDLVVVQNAQSIQTVMCVPPECITVDT